METARNRSGPDAGLRRQPVADDRGRRQAGRRIEEARPVQGVRAAPVEGAHPLFEDPSQVVLGQRDQEVEALAPPGPEATGRCPEDPNNMGSILRSVVIWTDRQVVS
jgi:hypothetical protein